MPGHLYQILGDAYNGSSTPNYPSSITAPIPELWPQKPPDSNCSCSQNNSQPKQPEQPEQPNVAESYQPNVEEYYGKQKSSCGCRGASTLSNYDISNYLDSTHVKLVPAQPQTQTQPQTQPQPQTQTQSPTQAVPSEQFNNGGQGSSFCNRTKGGKIIGNF